MNNFRFLLSYENKSKISGLSLAELLIATSLIILIVITASVLDIASRRFYSKAERGVAALQDVSLAMEYIQKSGEIAIGDASSVQPAFEEDLTGATFCAGYTSGVRFIVDLNQNGMWDDPTTTDGYNTFCYDAANHTLNFLETGEIIARRLVHFAEENTTDPGVVFFCLASRDNPDLAPSTDNPDVYLEARVYPRSSSLR